MTVARLAGRVAGVPLAPGSFLGRRDGVVAGQGAWGKAVTRFQAVTMAVARGHVAAILR
jgi:hypothetical protein